MNYRIIPQKYFLGELKRLAKRCYSLKQDPQALQSELSSNLSAGIDLDYGIRKIHMAIGSKNKEKGHGTRVTTCTYTVNDTKGTINLIHIYDKGRRKSIIDNEIK